MPLQSQIQIRTKRDGVALMEARHAESGLLLLGIISVARLRFYMWVLLKDKIVSICGIIRMIHNE